jgi:SAM-dependent methyltransferase
MARSTTDKQWDKWAEADPYRGVLGIDTSAMSTDETRAAFFDSGARHIDDVMARVDRYLGGLQRRDAALDFGCGVGRLVRPLAERFATVTGVDIAPKMLEIAAQNTAVSGNVTFSQTLATVTDSGARFDLVHSYIVLQHIRPEQGEPIIRELIGLVRPGGVFALHFTTGDSKSSRAAMNWVRYRVAPVHWAYNVVRSRPWNESITEMNRYDVFTVLEMAKQAGCEATVAVSIDQNGHKGVMLVGKVGVVRA